MTSGGPPNLPLLWLLEGDLNRPLHGGPLKPTEPPQFTPMHLRIEHDAAKGKTQATVVNVTENRTQVMDNPLGTFLAQWFTGPGNTGVTTLIDVALFDRWDLIQEPIATLLRVLRPFP